MHIVEFDHMLVLIDKYSGGVSDLLDIKLKYK